MPHAGRRRANCSVKISICKRPLVERHHIARAHEGTLNIGVWMRFRAHFPSPRRHVLRTCLERGAKVAIAGRGSLELDSDTGTVATKAQIVTAPVAGTSLAMVRGAMRGMGLERRSTSSTPDTTWMRLRRGTRGRRSAPGDVAVRRAASRARGVGQAHGAADPSRRSPPKSPLSLILRLRRPTVQPRPAGPKQRPGRRRPRASLVPDEEVGAVTRPSIPGSGLDRPPTVRTPGR